jgi:hypothetical protein
MELYGCFECDKLLGAWTEAVNTHSRIVCRLTAAIGDCLPDQADEAAEIAMGARAVYLIHRVKHGLKATFER